MDSSNPNFWRVTAVADLHDFLWKLRITLWVAFFVACIGFALINPIEFKFSNELRYAPVVALALACSVGIFEKLARWWYSHPPKRWLGASQWWGLAQSELYATIRIGKVKQGMAKEAIRVIQSGSLPVLKDIDGFRGYLVVEGSDDTFISMALFDSQPMAESAGKALVGWIQDNLKSLTASPVQTLTGTVILSA